MKLRRVIIMATKVFIRTSCLRYIPTFISNVFHNDPDILKGKSLELVSTGGDAFQFLPKKPVLFDLNIFTITPIAISETTISSLSYMRPE